jgi:biotin-(acetyl-CoA carboxylase) ligase
MAVQIEDGDISGAQADLRNAEEALRQALERGASDQEIKALMDQLRAAMDRFMQALAEQLKNHQQLSRPLGQNQRVISQRDLQSMLDQLEKGTRAIARLKKILAAQTHLHERTTSDEGDGQLETLSRDQSQILQFLQRLIEQLPR